MNSNLKSKNKLCEKYPHLTEKDVNILKNNQYYKDAHHEILAELINTFVPNSTGIEIGVLRAATSRYILSHTTTKNLHLIDPWKVYEQTQYRDILKNQKRADSLYAAVVEIMHDKNCLIYRNSIEEIIDHLPDNIGFVFIDGNHTYKGVMNDLHCVVPKIRSKGLVSGHDWASNYPGVVKAVTEYFMKSDEFLPPFTSYDLKHNHCPAPSGQPIVNKSWTKGHLWWAIKK